jgi:hypothetical protein
MQGVHKGLGVVMCGSSLGYSREQGDGLERFCGVREKGSEKLHKELDHGK